MNFLPTLLQACSFGLAAGSSPGPLQTFLLSESLRGGWRRGAMVALAPLVSDTPIIILCIVLLNHLSITALRVVQGLGGFYVLWLAWQALRRWQSGTAQGEAKQAGFSSLWQAAWINLLNPNPYLFWLGQAPTFVLAWQTSPLYAGVYLLGFYGVFLGMLVGLAVLSAQGQRLGDGFVRGMLLVSGLVLLGLGCRLLFLAFWGGG
ncbi:MAG TPA: LysE family translocator [Anaerolineales bacterium]|nr:LysE family translocator [Anaerolineales bacterium]